MGVQPPKSRRRRLGMMLGGAIGYPTHQRVQRVQRGERGKETSVSTCLPAKKQRWMEDMKRYAKRCNRRRFMNTGKMVLLATCT